MADPYVGEIRLFAGNFAPVNWAFCNGQLLPISDYESLYALIGISYGGNGTDSFALPDLQGRVPVHTPVNMPVGGKSGAETVTLTGSNLPVHSHPIAATNMPANTGNPTNALLGNVAASGIFLYMADTPRLGMANGGMSTTGGNAAHDNVQPFICVSFIIALTGIYPSQG